MSAIATVFHADVIEQAGATRAGRGPGCSYMTRLLYRLAALTAGFLVVLVAGSAPPSFADTGSKDGQITVFLAGDSTMAEKLPEKRPETGWGEFLQSKFDPGKVRIQNHAQNGRSTRTFIGEGRWQALVDQVKPGDYVFIQFGHNDESPEKVDRYTPPAQFSANLARFVTDVRAKSGTPVLMTPVMRRRFDDEGQFYDVHGIYPDLTRAVAADLDVALIDMHRKSEALLRRLGPEQTKALFLILAPGENPNYPDGVDDNTHFSPLGAGLMADLAVDGIRELNLDLAGLLLERPASSRLDATFSERSSQPDSHISVAAGDLLSRNRQFVARSH